MLFYIFELNDQLMYCKHYFLIIAFKKGLPWWLRRQRICLQCRRLGFDPWVGKIPWRREWQPTSVFLPGEFSGQRSLAGYSPPGHKQLDKTEATKAHTQDVKCYITWTSLKILYLIMKQEIPFLNSKFILIIWLEILPQLYLKVLKTKWVHAIICSWIEIKVDVSHEKVVCTNWWCNDISHKNPSFPWKQ